MLRFAAAALALYVVASPAAASRVEHGYLTLSDGTLLNYTVTRPEGTDRHPVLLKYDPYAAGVYSDPSWNEAGYIVLGVNMRGTGCSQGVFQPLRADVWGADGAEVVAWAAAQPWSSGAVGMIGYSFTGVSQLATAAFAGPALKAITPGNVFLDFYRDSIYPGGIHNGWIPAWIAAGRQFVVGADTVRHAPADPLCAPHVLQSQPPAAAQALDTQQHPYDDAYWATQPAAFLDRARIPVLGCVNWQDSTIYSRAGDAFREQLNPATTWLVGGNGAHADCPVSRARLQRFFDRYLKQQANGWEATPRLLLIHEQTGESSVREALNDQAGAWQTAFADWSALDAAIKPLTLYLRAGGMLDTAAPTNPEPADSYAYPTPTANTPADWMGLNSWGRTRPPSGVVRYTTPALAQDLEFLGSGSANLWLSSTAPDTDVQITLMEVRPDGQETYVQNGWLRLSHRKLDERRSTALRPYHTHKEADAENLPAGESVLARIELLPFNHVFRAGSAIRLEIDAPGGWFQILPTPAINSVHHEPGMASALVLGWLPGRTAAAPLPPCGTLLNQPCRPSSAPVPVGQFAIQEARSNTVPVRGDHSTPRGGGGNCDPLWLLTVLLMIGIYRNRTERTRF
jgi:uncharacterized protein